MSQANAATTTLHFSQKRTSAKQSNNNHGEQPQLNELTKMPDTSAYLTTEVPIARKTSFLDRLSFRSHRKDKQSPARAKDDSVAWCELGLTTIDKIGLLTLLEDY